MKKQKQYYFSKGFWIIRTIVWHKMFQHIFFHERNYEPWNRKCKMKIVCDFRSQFQESTSGVNFQLQKSTSGVNFRSQLQESTSGVNFRSQLQKSIPAVNSRGQLPNSISTVTISQSLCATNSNISSTENDSTIVMDGNVCFVSIAKP